MTDAYTIEQVIETDRHGNRLVHLALGGYAIVPNGFEPQHAIVNLYHEWQFERAMDDWKGGYFVEAEWLG